MSLELMLNSVNVNLVAFSHFFGDFRGQIIAIFVIAITASEVAIALGILVALMRNKATLDVVDQVVVENGVRPDEALYYALKDQSRNKGQVDIEALYAIQPQPALATLDDDADAGFVLFRLGDCTAPRNTHAAIYDALRICKDF